MKSFLLGITFFCTLDSIAQEVNITGAMSNVMKKGQLQGTILLDTIQNKTKSYGLGPVEFLKGELLLIDGKTYVSSVGENGAIRMDETFQVKAPFFVYTHLKNWKKITLPKKVKTIKDLEKFIDLKAKSTTKPFAFKLQGTFDKINFHIQNLPEGAVVKSPKDAHQGQGKYEREKVNGEIIGFFSRTHQTIFTHHDTYIHMHYINKERTEMGHIDHLIINTGKSKIKMYLQTE